MNRFIVLLAALLVGGAAFTLTRTARQPSALLDTMPELNWLQSELKLDAPQFEKAAGLHRAYRPRCEELCARIFEARTKVDREAAAASGKLTPELTAALDAQARVHAECQKAMIAHLYETAAIMTPEQSERYLKATLPYALSLSSYQKLQAH